MRVVYIGLKHAWSLVWASKETQKEFHSCEYRKDSQTIHFPKCSTEIQELPDYNQFILRSSTINTTSVNCLTSVLQDNKQMGWDSLLWMRIHRLGGLLVMRLCCTCSMWDTPMKTHGVRLWLHFQLCLAGKVSDVKLVWTGARQLLSLSIKLQR